jgi:hypothetical protein
MNNDDDEEDRQQHQHQHQSSDRNTRITYRCPICLNAPNSHSFQLLGVFNDILYMYTCPEKAILYDDVEGILNHYRGILDTIQGRNWIWFFDASGFSQKHYFQIKLSIELAKLITNPTYSNTLHSILIYNPTWHVNMTLTLVKPFLSNSVKNKIFRVKQIPIFLRNHPVFSG